jgi:hypothetical protein
MKLRDDGYAQMGIGSRRAGTKTTVLAHRFAWELANGAIPTGLHVCHRCDNRACCNADHYFLGTQRDNIRDAAAKGRMSKGASHHAAKLTDADAREILISIGTHREIGKRFGVSRSMVTAIRSRKWWKHVHVD